MAAAPQGGLLHRRARGVGRRGASAVLAVAAIVFTAAGGPGAGTAPATASDASFGAGEDATVYEAYPNANFGTSLRLRADASPGATSYLRFLVHDLAGPVTRATLELYATSSLAQRVEARAVLGDWSESTVTAASAPPTAVTPTSSAGPVVAGTWVELDVTPLVAGNGPVNLALTTDSATAVAFASREAGADVAPRLVVGTSALEPPVNQSPPTVSGTPVQGETLSAGIGVWSGSEPVTFAYQWQRCDSSGGSCSDVSAAYGPTYVLSAADVDAALRVAVTATNAGGSATAVSEARTVRPPTIAVAGDIACDPASSSFNGGAGTATSCHQRATSNLLVGLAAAGELQGVLTLGDTQYESGNFAAFLGSFDPSWGRVKPLIHPAVGNHDYLTAGAAGYFQYFGAAAGDPSRGYYSSDVGSWHLVALNSNCSAVGGCGAGSPQETWLASDLAAHQDDCTLLYWHHPRWSSGQHGNDPRSAALVRDAYATGADVLLVGHDHDYERFAPQDPDGHADPERGLREFVVGTGGKSHYGLGTPAANSEIRNGGTFGVLELKLYPQRYEWRFRPEAGATFTDAGAASCHHAAVPDVTPPTAPQLSARSAASNHVELSWTGATDDIGVTAYRLRRDGAPIATAGTTGYGDDGLVAGVTYVYTVEALDAAGNVSLPSNAVTVTTPAGDPMLFADGFESGDLGVWTHVAGLTVDGSVVHSAGLAARATSTGTTTAYAYEQLSAPSPDVTSRVWFDVLASHDTVDLLKLRTPTGTAIQTVFLSADGRLGYQNNVSTLSALSDVRPAAGEWHELQVHLVVAGASSRTEITLDGQPVAELSRADDFGSVPVGRFQLGENIIGRSYDVAFDDISFAEG